MTEDWKDIFLYTQLSSNYFSFKACIFEFVCLLVMKINYAVANVYKIYEEYIVINYSTVILCEKDIVFLAEFFLV